MKRELKEDIVASWDEVNEALTSLKDLDTQEIIACLPAITERLENAQRWLGKYVTASDVVEGV